MGLNDYCICFPITSQSYRRLHKDLVDELRFKQPLLQKFRRRHETMPSPAKMTEYEKFIESTINS